ncbi:MAG: hypothetical protein ACETVU_00430, partial [Desulfatiglandales bacterium]
MSSRRYKKQFRIIAGLIVLVVLIGGGGVASYLVRYSATNELVCRQCHPEISELWRESKGHPADQTRCYECHSQGLEFIPKDWNAIKHARDQFVPP